MRSRLFAPLFVAGILVASSALAATTPLQDRAHEVRSAIPASIAYYYDHGTWRGMTLAKLRRYDRSIKGIVVRGATKRAFCIQSVKTPFVHFDGPAGKVRKGRCGVRGAVIPFVPRPGTTTTTPITDPQRRIRNAVPAAEAYNVDHNGYAGMTLAALRGYDASITDIRIVRATRDTYCIESGTGAEQYHKDGPGEAIAPGPCPAG
jgi:hypothetical protein